MKAYRDLSSPVESIDKIELLLSRIVSSYIHNNSLGNAKQEDYL